MTPGEQLDAIYDAVKNGIRGREISTMFHNSDFLSRDISRMENVITAAGIYSIMLDAAESMEEIKKLKLALSQYETIFKNAIAAPASADTKWTQEGFIRGPN